MIEPRSLTRINYFNCKDKLVAHLPVTPEDVIVTSGKILPDGMIDLNDNFPRYRVSADGEGVLFINTGRESSHAPFGTIHPVRDGHEELWLLDVTADTVPSKSELLERWQNDPASRLSTLARTFTSRRP